MGSGQYNNIISVSIGVLIIVTCTVTAYLSQKHFFSKQKYKTKNALNKQNNQNNPPGK